MKGSQKDVTKTAIFLLLFVFFLKGALLASLVSYWQSPAEFHEASFVHLMAEKKAVPAAEDIIPDEFRLAYQKAFLPGSSPDSAGIPGLPVIRNNFYYLGLSLLSFVTKGFGFKLELFVLRLTNVLLGVLVVWVAFLIGRLIFPGNGFVQLTLPLLTAFHPQFSLVSSRVGVVNFYILAFTLLIFLVVKGAFGFSPPLILAVGAVLLLGIPPEHRLLIGLPVLAWLLVLRLFRHDLRAMLRWGEERIVLLLLSLLTLVFSWSVFLDVGKNLFQLQPPPVVFLNPSISLLELGSIFWGQGAPGIAWSSFSQGPFIATALGFLSNLALVGSFFWFAGLFSGRFKIKKPLSLTRRDIGLFAIFAVGLLIGFYWGSKPGQFRYAFSFLRLFSFYALLILLFISFQKWFDFKLSAFKPGEQKLFFSLVILFLFGLYGLKAYPPISVEGGSYALLGLIPFFVLIVLGMFQLIPRDRLDFVTISLAVVFIGVNLFVIFAVLIPKYYLTLDQFIFSQAENKPLLPFLLTGLISAFFIGACLAYLNRVMQLSGEGESGGK